ncbi:MAG: type IX secretion system membrane protein PorP/SprF [Bacteroidales bacterium]|nr:type IX secretion system membrane protein PorP/SprF [Bacteroidales bacterium]MCF8345034.1 type IX secretion system membrane protein PorP/SprF [Bacteroidales bacterium]MCF8351918.1 type IX secretion system membrane protein PorP/SprF [Bacteroidales bacterium]MCF8376453.1 type IX secretion system membrane protein PorP/SprF [Bacteroidales bacterium]MCF8400572.1 type IX secretion system membrane protein PorP/SprF [Bacteroidales bacterium]
MAGLILFLNAQAQQDPQFSQYMFNKMSFNPGFAGNSGGICINGAVRQQWVGFEDPEGNSVAPETFLLTADAPFRVLRGGLSAVIMQDKIGFWKDISLRLGYAYRTTVGRGNLGIGTQIAFINRSVDFSKFITVQDDPLLSELSAEETDMLFDFSLGVYYEVPETYYLGISAMDVLQSAGKDLSGKGLKYTVDRALYFTGGYNFPIPNNPSFEIKPSFLVKVGQASSQYDISTLIEYNDKFWGGLSYRMEESIVVIIGMLWRDFRIGYSYDIVTTGYGLGGTHEITAGYCFKLKLDKFRKIYRNTRFL